MEFIRFELYLKSLQLFYVLLLNYSFENLVGTFLSWCWLLCRVSFAQLENEMPHCAYSSLFIKQQIIIMKKKFFSTLKIVQAKICSVAMLGIITDQMDPFVSRNENAKLNKKQRTVVYQRI